ncbi:DUF2637 domain-containing protein [Nocardiopsis synnemataformans]|uniref:DUF2637 domain-containing protein n=1 Tax=Nocardiopsis synnemataformans TaxID=61305 RepID=UPI003EB69534
MLPHSLSGLFESALTGVEGLVARAVADASGETLVWAGLIAVVVTVVVGGLGLWLAVRFVTRQAQLVTGLAKRVAKRSVEQMREMAEAEGDRFQVLTRLKRLKKFSYMKWVTHPIVFGCMAYSGYGVVQAVEEHTDLNAPVSWFFFVVFEGAAITIMMMISDRADQAQPYRGLLVGYWALMLLCAGIQTTHVDDPVGQVLFATTTIVAAGLFATRQAAVRKDQDERLKKAQGRWVNRKLELVRWLRPMESLRVQLEKASDAQMSTDEATRRVRERVAQRRQDRALNRVMWAVWRLRRAQQTHDAFSFGKTLLRWVEHNHLVLTQREIARARLSASPQALEDLLLRLEAMDLAPKLARMGSATDARLIAGSFGSFGSPVRFGSGLAPGGVGGSVPQFALPAARVRPEPEPERGVRVFMVEPSGSSDGSGARGSGFDSARSGAVRGSGEPGAQGELRGELVRDGSGGGSVRFDDDPEPIGVELGGVEPGFVPAGEPVRSGSGHGSGEFEPQGELQGEPVRSGSAPEAGVWRHADDGWTPPSTDEAWEGAWPRFPEELFPAPTPQRRTPPVPEKPSAPVRQYRSMEELQEELRQALAEGKVTRISTEAIYPVLRVGKPRAAQLRDWAKAEGLRPAAVEAEQAQ